MLKVPQIEKAPSIRAEGVMSILPMFVLIGGVVIAACLEFVDHAVELRLPHSLEPFGIAEPLYQCGTNGIVCANEGAAIPSFGQGVVSIAAKRPYLWAVIRTINTSCNIATTA